MTSEDNIEFSLNKKTVAIIQARMGSTRLPGKVVLDIGGKSMLDHVVHRVRRCREVDSIVVATSTLAKDQAIVEECNKLKVSVYRGSEEDVLFRYYQAAEHYEAKIVVRFCSDSPLIDPNVSDGAIRLLKDNLDTLDVCTIIAEKTYPLGLHTEALTFETLEKAHLMARKDFERSHVTPYIYENSHLFRIKNIACTPNYSHHRWTVDTQEDIDFARAIYKRMKESGKIDDFSWKDVLEIVEKEPQLSEINASIIPKPLREG